MQLPCHHNSSVSAVRGSDEAQSNPPPESRLQSLSSLSPLCSWRREGTILSEDNQPFSWCVSPHPPPTPWKRKVPRTSECFLPLFTYCTAWFCVMHLISTALQDPWVTQISSWFRFLLGILTKYPLWNITRLLLRSGPAQPPPTSLSSCGIIKTSS